VRRLSSFRNLMLVLAGLLVVVGAIAAWAVFGGGQ
jgi:hypothetical protein